MYSVFTELRKKREPVKAARAINSNLSYSEETIEKADMTRLETLQKCLLPSPILSFLRTYIRYMPGTNVCPTQVW